MHVLILDSRGWIDVPLSNSKEVPCSCRPKDLSNVDGIVAIYTSYVFHAWLAGYAVLRPDNRWAALVRYT